MKVLQAIAGFVSDKEFKELDPAFVDRIIASIPAISNYGKISIRTNMMVHGGFPFDTGHGVTIPVNLGGGRQVGLIIKRVNSRIEVRLVWGFLLDGQVGVFGGGKDGDFSGEAGGKLEGAWYRTEGISAHFEITYNPQTGREDFSAVQSYLRDLLTGELPSTEHAAKKMFNFQRITKSGGQKNANSQAAKKISKFTSNTTFSAGASVGLNLGYKQAAGSQVADLGAPITKDQILGVSAGEYAIDLENTALYDVGRDYDFDWITNIGPVKSVEEALKKCGAAKTHVERLLDRETTLQNGETVKFRDAVDQALKLLHTNDGFLLQWVPKPEAKALVNRNLDRIAQITEQILPRLDSRFIGKQILRRKKTLAATRLRNPKKLDREQIKSEIVALEIQQSQLEAQRQTFKDELQRLAHEIAMRKNPDNLDYFDLEAVYIMPIVMQTDTKTVLNLAGLLNVGHSGTRMHDTIVACIPAHKPEAGRRAADNALAERARQIQEGAQFLEPAQRRRPPRNAAERGILEQSSDDRASSEEEAGTKVVRVDRVLSWADNRPPASFEGSEPVSPEDDDLESFSDEYVLRTPTPPLSPPPSPSWTEEVLVRLEGSSSGESPPRTPLRLLQRSRVDRLKNLRNSPKAPNTAE
jgi:hypothetical protein